MAMTSDFSIAFFFYLTVVVLLLSCPVTSRVYRTHNAIIIEGKIFFEIKDKQNCLMFCGADDIGDADSSTISRNRRELRTDGRSCTTMSGSPGYCSTLHSCYPNLSQSQLSFQEVGMLITRSKCQYFGVHDEQVFIHLE
jgi:hypothetical protein